jgi:DHA1 family bicyclomycin/chloramphenicol resistance-like MFS transporter
VNATPPPAPSGRTRDPAGVAFGFILLMACLGAVNAFSTDVVMPALGHISDSFGLTNENARQWIILAVFAGMAPSQFVIGPLSDAIGRRRAVFLSFGLFAAGTLVAMFSQDFSWHIAGRVLQGLGSGGLRIVGMAITRDRYTGRAMAQVVSLSFSIFILVILFAPLIGQLVILWLPWRMVHLWLLFFAGGVALWFALSQPETLNDDHRRPLAFGSLTAATAEAMRHPATLGCTLALGAALGAFMSYLASAQQIYGEIYQLGPMLPVAFGALSLVFGGMSLVNAFLVARFGVVRVVRAGLRITYVGSALAWLAFSHLHDGIPPLWMFMLGAVAPFSGFGMVYGNLSALALTPMGHIAGSASSVVAAFSTVIAIALAWVIGDAFDGTVLPLFTAFFGCAIFSAALLGVLDYWRHLVD